jgi:hypothetical protein
MPVRQPAVAGRFYPADRARCIREIERCLPDSLPSDLPERIVGGIVPHAGWAFSGPTAAKVFSAIASQFTPDTVVLLSAMHARGASQPALYGSGAWRTPLGEAPVDEELAQVLLSTDGEFVDRPAAHAGEHSAEVQVPFIQHLFPEAQILPIMMPPDQEAVSAGKVLGQTLAASDRRVVAVGTSDLTHYGPSFYGFAPAGTGQDALDWVRENDRRVIDLMLDLKARKIVPETTAHHNACGGGAIAATVAAARKLGAEEGVLLEYTTSYDVRPQGVPSDFVGYAAVVF